MKFSVILPHGQDFYIVLMSGLVWLSYRNCKQHKRGGLADVLACQCHWIFYRVMSACLQVHCVSMWKGIMEGGKE